MHSFVNKIVLNSGYHLHPFPRLKCKILHVVSCSSLYRSTCTYIQPNQTAVHMHMADILGMVIVNNNAPP